MAIIPNSVPLTGPIAPIDDTDTYPTWFARYGKGGFRSVDDLAALAAIPDLHLEEGMLVKIIADDTYYTYKNGGWVLESFNTAPAEGGNLNYQVRTANFTAESFFVYGVDTTANAVTATLGVKTNSDVVYFADATIGAVTHNPLTILGDGCTVAGAASLTLTNNAECVGLIYDAANTNWVIFGTESSGTSGDGGGADAEPYRIINGTSELGFYTAGSVLEGNIAGKTYFFYDTGSFGTANVGIGEEVFLNSVGNNRNVALGCFALGNSAANDNVGIGHTAGASTTTGYNNCFLGSFAGYSNTTGFSNIGIGRSSLNLNTTGTENIALGDSALRYATGSSYNIAIGSESLSKVTEGYDNVAVGRRTMKESIGAIDCVAVGNYALVNNRHSDSNVGIGYGALYYLNPTLGEQANQYAANVAIGDGAGCSVFNSLTGGSVFVGSFAGASGGGLNNVGIGLRAAESLTTGENNVFIGALSGAIPGSGFSWGTQYNNPAPLTGSNNIVVGAGTSPSNLTISNEITLGNSGHTSLRCAVTSITSLSDQRDKTNIHPLTLGLDFIKKLKPVEFEWNTRDGAKVGVKDFNFIAQDLKRAQEEVDAPWLGLVLENNPDKLEATPGRLIPILVKAIQELELRLTQQDAEIQLLKAQLS